MSTQETLSVCSMNRDDMSRMVSRMEMHHHLPVHLQMYSDMYKEYLHTPDDVYGTCIMAENTFEEMLPLQDILEHVRPYADGMTDMQIRHIDDYEGCLKWYTRMRIYDESIHAMINSYAGMPAGIAGYHEELYGDTR